MAYQKSSAEQEIMLSEFTGSASETWEERIKRLRGKVDNAPTQPGVYVHRDIKGQVLYVGKAKNLRNRLRSYFTGSENHSPKTKSLVSRIHNFEVIVSENENESLILENNLIKHNMPPFNILLRDDKQYPYLKLDLNEPWPRFIQTRRRKNDGAVYFGPYASGAELSRVTNIIYRHFNLVKCTPKVFATVKRPCNYYDIKRCLAPCKLPVDRAEYMEQVENVVRILRGKTSEVAARTKLAMQQAAENLHFEKAAILRDQLKALENLSAGQSVVFPPGLNLDVICYHPHRLQRAFFSTILRDGKVVGGEGHIVDAGLLLDTKEDSNDTHLSAAPAGESALLVQYVCQFYAKREVPDIICLPQAKGLLSAEEVQALRNYLGEMKQQRNAGTTLLPQLFFENSFPAKIFIDACNDDQKLTEPSNQKSIDNKRRSPFKAKETQQILNKSFFSLVKSCCENAKNRMHEVIKVEEKNLANLASLQELLKLPSLPIKIECYDISTFQGDNIVASGVTFINGMPEKSLYRKYIIQSVDKQDDFASLREVTRRRFSDEKRQDIPDIFLVDGGEPQVREVSLVLASLGLHNVPLFGIAKSRTRSAFTSKNVSASKERLVMPARHGNLLAPDKPPTTIFLHEFSAEFRLLTHIRDEAHRFAITFHRKRRDQKSQGSMLSKIKGLGPKTRKLLLKEFGSVKMIATLTADELVERGKIRRRLAEKIIDALKGQLP